MYRENVLISHKTNHRRVIVFLLCATAVAALHRPEVFAHGTSHELIEAATREIASRPDDAPLYLRRANLHLEHGDWRACLLDVDEAERRQTQDLGAGFVRARAQAAGGFFAEAKASVDKFLAVHPTHAAALMQRARVFGALGKKAEAAEEFVRAMSHVSQPEPDEVFELAALLCAAGRDADALAAVDRASKATPGVPSLVECGVKIEIGLGNFDGALRRIGDAIAAARIKEPLMARRASVLAQAGRFSESLAAWRELQARLAALPAGERGSHAMSSLSERTRHAIGALTSLQPQTPKP